MFDPFGIYQREKKKTSKGQILRKKPVSLEGSVSSKDLPMIERYAEALGYKLFPLNYRPPQPPPPAIVGSVFYEINFGNSLRAYYSNASKSLYDVRRLMYGTEDILNIPDEFAQRIKRFTIFMTINSFRMISAETNVREAMTVKLLGNNNIQFNLEPNEEIIFTHSEHDNGPTHVQGLFLDHNNHSVIETQYTLSIPTSPVVGPIASQTITYENDQALEFYLDYKNATENVLSLIPVLYAAQVEQPPRGYFDIYYNATVFCFVDFE